MRSEHLIGTSIPRFTYDTPLAPGNDFYALCQGSEPLAMIFLPAFGHPIAREYIARYLKSLGQLKEVRLACVVRSSSQEVASVLEGRDFPFPLICDGQGVLYNFMGVEQAGILQSWSFAAQRIFKNARAQGFSYDKNAPQMLPLTLVIGPEGKILFAHYGRSLTDLPEDCGTIRSICEEVRRVSQAAGKKSDPARSDETLTLPDLAQALGRSPEEEESDAMSSLFF